jgi:hypothetical protein
LASSACKLVMSASMVMQVRGKDAMVLASNSLADRTLAPSGTELAGTPISD